MTTTATPLAGNAVAYVGGRLNLYPVNVLGGAIDITTITDLATVQAVSLAFGGDKVYVTAVVAVTVEPADGAGEIAVYRGTAAGRVTRLGGVPFAANGGLVDRDDVIVVAVTDQPGDATGVWYYVTGANDT